MKEVSETETDYVDGWYMNENIAAKYEQSIELLSEAALLFDEWRLDKDHEKMGAMSDKISVFVLADEVEILRKRIENMNASHK